MSYPYLKKMHRKLNVLLFLLLFLAVSHQVSQAREDLVKKGQREMDFMKYRQAAHYFEQAVLDDPKIKNARTKLAFCYFRLGEHDKAVKALEEERALFPESLNALILLGYVHFIKGQEEKAAEVCQGIDAALKPAVKEMRKKRGKSADKIDDKFFVDELSRQNPNLGLPDYILGVYHKKNRNFKEAEEYFRRASQRGYSAVDCYVQLISLELDQGEWEKGLAVAREAIETWSPQGEFYFLMASDLLGSIFFKLQDFEKSLQFYENVMALDPEDAMSYYNRGCVHFSIKNFEKAEEDWKKAIDVEKLIKKEEQKEKQPRDELKLALTVQVRPITFEAHKSLGSLYLKQSLKEKALEEFERANEIEPDDLEPYFEIGKILYELKEIAKAQFYFNRYLYLGGKEEKVKEILKSQKVA